MTVPKGAEEKPAVLFFDSDGTLIDEEKHAVPASAADAVRLARRKGHLAFLNTGRPYMQTATDVFAIGLDGFICSCGMYIRVGNAVIEDVRLDQAYCRELRDEAKKMGIQVIYESYDSWFYDSRRFGTPWSTQEMEIIRKTEAKIYDSPDVPEFRFEKFLVWKDEADFGSFLDRVMPDFGIMDRGLFYECVPRGYTKADAIGKLLRYLHLEDAETYAFGDSANDIEMLNSVKHPVIMSNAPEDLKHPGYYVTGTAGENGIAEAMRHFRLI